MQQHHTPLGVQQQHHTPLGVQQQHHTPAPSVHPHPHPQQAPRCVLLSFDPHLAESGGGVAESGGGGRPPEGCPPAATPAVAAAAALYRATLLGRVRARAAAEGHPTFPSDNALQRKALDGTLAAMEWPGQAEACASGARLVRVDPCVPTEQQLALVLEALFGAFWWTVNIW